MDGFIFFLIFIFIIVPIIKNIFGSKKSAKKNTRAKTSQWGQSHKQLKDQQLKNPQQNSVSANRDKGNHSPTRYQTHQRTHQRTQDQIDRERAQDLRQRDAHQRLESLQNRKRGRDIIRIGNKGRDDWGVRGDNSGVGAVITVVILGIIIFFIISEFAPVLMDMLNDF